MKIIISFLGLCVLFHAQQIIAAEEELQPFGLPLLRDIPERFWPKADNRIFGGEEVEPHSLPYQVALYVYSANNAVGFCGGSIISNQYILTAAHCLWKQKRAEVILGGHDLGKENKNQVVIEVESAGFVLHEDFTYTVTNDIAVIRLPTPIKFTEAIQPISLPSYSDKTTNLVGTTATISGWGKTESNSLSQVLLKTEEKIITHNLCVYFYGDKVKNDLHVCTGGENGKGACNGDSGGPLVIDSKQVGIVSFGPSWIVGCLNFDFPTGYTRVTEYLDWIDSHTDVNILYE